MRIEKLSIRQFRNCSAAELEFSPGVNFFVGKNGQGKTSALEAVSVLTTLRSFRSSHFEEMIQTGQASAELKAEIDFAQLKHQAKMVFTRQEKRVSKEIVLNGKMMRTSSQYLNTRFGSVRCGFHSIVFNPADHDLVRGDPTGRRAFLDRVLSAENVDYFNSLARFKKALESRNALLKQGGPQNVLQNFTEIFVNEGVNLVISRLGWIKRVNPLLKEYAEKIAPGAADYQIVPQSKWITENDRKASDSENLSEANFPGQCYTIGLEFLKKRLFQRLEETKFSEREAKSTLVGPHRDEWVFRYGNHVLKAVGSQGEVRTALLALKLSEIELFRMQTNGDPILLLDDFSSELDSTRRKALLQFLSETPLQVFVTSTELPSDLAFGKVFEVSEGRFEMG